MEKLVDYSVMCKLSFAFWTKTDECLLEDQSCQNYPDPFRNDGASRSFLKSVAQQEEEEEDDNDDE